MNVSLHRVDAGFNRIAVLEYEARRARDVTLVVGHGYSSSKQNLDGLCSFLGSHGFGVYALDFPGHKLGASGGRLRSSDDLVDAMAAVVRFARERGATEVYTVGHSMGATTALCAAGADPTIAGAVSIATGYGRIAALDAFAARGVVDLRSSYVDGLTLQQLSAEWESLLDDALLGLAGRPLLVVGAERDAMVTKASVQGLFDRASEPKQLAFVDSDHTFAGDNSRATVLGWLSAMHPRRAAAAPETPLIDAPL
ncbi:MAG TPA: alpha/beta fold hydrolase [Candidatus Elarobacter sp.]|jgi:esterase/lipase